MASLEAAAVVRDGRTILGPIGLEVRSGQHWVVLGPNGAGKSTLLGLLAARGLPSSGQVVLVGNRVGACDLRRVREQIAVVGSVLGRTIRAGITLSDLVYTGLHNQLERWWMGRPTPLEQEKVETALVSVGLDALRDQTFGAASDGERQRCLVARALVSEPALLLLDEPMAGLDLAGREHLIGLMDHLAQLPAGPTTVLVTHQLEEIPSSTTHALILKSGRCLSAGPLETVLTGEWLTAAYDLPIEVTRTEGRLTVRAAPAAFDLQAARGEQPAESSRLA